MKISQVLSTLSLLVAFSAGIALIALDYQWAARCAGVWVCLYYTFLIIDQYENTNQE